MPDALSCLQAALAERYTVQRELGRGGMATVYLAEDRKHHRPVAVKVLKPPLAQALGAERFLREIAIAARLHHPHVLSLFDSGEASGLLFYVMPYVEGESLRDRLAREKQLRLDDALQIAREVADALSYAHTHGVVHRDIKPDNILLEFGHALVADFGIARAITVAAGEDLTATGLAVGTPAYMSPEQAGRSKELDGRSDLYSLGCVLYEMLAGHAPFSGQSAREILARHSLDLPPSLAAARPGVPEHVEAAISRALAKVPADRFRTMAEFSAALVRRDSAPGPAPGSRAAVTRAVEPSSSRRARLAVIAVACVAALAAGYFALRAWSAAPNPASPVYPRTAMAVLPFQNLSADSAHAYFAGGLHDQLLTQLSKVAALSLRGRASVMGYAGTTKTVGQIAEELKVGVLVEGSVQVVGARLRVNVQLIDAATDAHLWADSYDRTLDDAFAIQSEVAQQVVAAVGAALASGERRALAAAPTANAEAYRLYLQAVEYHRRPGYNRQNWEIAQQLYERALALDPEFAVAWAGLADIHGLMHWFRYDTSLDRIAALRAAAERAVRLAPQLPEARLAMGRWHYNRRDFAAALAEYGIALRGMPNNARVVARVGEVNRRLGNWEEVPAAFERAALLDPRDAWVFMELGCVCFLTLRRYAEALSACEEALRLAPDFHHAAVVKGWTHVIGYGALDSLRAVLHGIPSGAEVGSFGTRLAEHARLLFWERRPDSLLHVLAGVRAGVFDAQIIFVPTSLYAGWAHRLRGDRRAAVAAFDSAVAVLDSAMQRLSDDWRVRAARGLALAALGRSGAAVREARWLQQSVVYRNDAFWGPSFVGLHRAQILAQAGEADEALDEIERMLTRPSWTSVYTLRLDPLFDPISDHPRFQALLVRYGSR